MSVRVTGLDKLKRDSKGRWSGTVTVHLPATLGKKGLQFKAEISGQETITGVKVVAIDQIRKLLSAWNVLASAEYAKLLR